MKVTFLLTWADGMGGTEHAALTQAAHLAGRAEVEVISVFRTRQETFFGSGAPELTYLVDAEGTVQRPVRPSRLTDDECLSLSGQTSELIDVGWDPSFSRLSDLEMQHALRSLETDVLVTTTPALTAAAVQLTPPEILVVEQEHRPSQFRGPTGEPLLRCAPQLDALVALTDRTRDWLAESLGASAPRLLTIPNAIPDGFRPRSAVTNPVVVMAGRLVKDKRFDHAIEAFDRVADLHPGWTMRIFGDGPERHRLKRLIDALGRHDRIFMPGSCPDMAAEWAQAGLMALSSKDGEAMPLVLLEAFAAGVPAVAYDIATGPAELIRHEADGLLVPAGEIDLLAEAFGRLMGDDSMRVKFGESAWQRAQDFSPAHIVPQWEALFEELVASRNDPARHSDRLDRTGRRSAFAGAAFHPAVPADRSSGWRDDQRVAEDEIASRHPHLVRSGGRLAVVDDTLLHPAALAANLDLVCESLEAAGVPHVVIPRTETTTRVAVTVEDRPAAISALAGAVAGEAVYAELLAPRLQRPGTVLLADVPAVIDVKGLRVFRPVVTTSRTLRYGPAVACDVEFWPLDEDTGRRMAPLGMTVRGRTLPSLDADAAVAMLGRDRPTRSELALRDTTVVDEPIDAVWMWVDGADVAWQERMDRARALQNLPALEPDASGERFRDRDELRYSLRSVAMYAPWIRNCYLVTDDQVPSWLAEDHPGLTVVSHREIFADSAALPTFNSHAIESQLHRIPGLAEQFLVFNDDIFLARPLAPGAFFAANGTARCFPSPTQVSPGPVVPGEDDYLAGRKNARDLVSATFGRTPTHGYLHAPHAVLRSLLEELEDLYPEQFATTAASRFRSSDDITVVSALHHEHGWLTRRVERSTLRVAYVDTSKASDHATLTRLLTQRDRDVVCLNDGNEGQLTAAEQQLGIRAFLEAYFPVVGPFEAASD